MNTILKMECEGWSTPAIVQYCSKTQVTSEIDNYNICNEVSFETKRFHCRSMRDHELIRQRYASESPGWSLAPGGCCLPAGALSPPLTTS